MLFLKPLAVGMLLHKPLKVCGIKNIKVPLADLYRKHSLQDKFSMYRAIKKYYSKYFLTGYFLRKYLWQIFCIVKPLAQTNI